MNFFRRLAFSTKLFLGFSVVLLLTLLMSLVGLYQIRSLYLINDQLRSDWMPGIDILRKVNDSFDRYIIKELQHINENTPEGKQLVKNEIDSLLDVINQGTKDFEKLDLNDKSRKAHNGLERAIKDFFKNLSEGTIELSTKGDREGAMVFRRTKANIKRLENYRKAMSGLVKSSVEGGIATTNEIDVIFHQSLTRFLTLLGIAIVVGFLISYAVSRDISRQVGGEPSRIAHVASQVSEGDLDIHFNNNRKPKGINASVQGIVTTLKEVVNITKAIGQGDTSRKISPRSNRDELASSINEMVDFFQTQNNIKDNLNALAEQLSGNQSVRDVCTKSISFVARFTESAQGAVYWHNEEAKKLVLYGSFAFSERSRISNEYKLGEGLIGQVAIEQKAIMLKNVHLSEAMIETGLIQDKPLAIYALPLMYESKLCGVIELANFGAYTEAQKFFLQHATKIIATSMHTTEQNDEVKRLLEIAEEATRLAKAKQEEIAQANIQLQQQQEELRAQAEDLEDLNGNLEERIKERTLEINQQNEEIIAQNENIKETIGMLEAEKNKADELLKNILPEEIAKELKEKGKTDTHYYKLATVLFTDFEGFTQIASKLSPAQLVAELNANFEVFDRIIDKYGLEKIKTIGDAYMCAGGVPTANTTNPIDTVLAAIEIQAFMNQKHADYTAQGKEYWRLRLGVNSGELIAGVIGKKKFAYDIWGDAVNSASRMESNGMVGKVNISQNTYEYAKDFFVCEYRGKLTVKGKGEMEMYFVHGILPELSENQEGKVPNLLFQTKLNALEKTIYQAQNN